MFDHKHALNQLVPSTNLAARRLPSVEHVCLKVRSCEAAFIE